MSELEQRVRALRDEIAWPTTPALEPVLHERRRGHRARRALVVALAALALLAAGVLTFSPDARSAFLEVFGIRGATVVRVDELPRVDPVELDLGSRTDRATAERAAGFELVDLTGAGEPAAILLRGQTVSFVYGPVGDARIVFTQGRGTLWDGFVKKVGATGTRVETTEVDGEPALFVTGDEHFVMFVDANGSVTDERTALAGTVLLWNRGPLLLRLEGDLTREQALELARSVE